MEIFSLQRNYRRLVSVPTNKLGRELRYLQAVRYLFMFVIIFGHLTYIFTRVPISNTHYFEQVILLPHFLFWYRIRGKFFSWQKYYTLWGMLQLNGSHIVQTFFLISGLLMGLAFKDIYKKEKFTCSYSWIAIIYRYIRNGNWFFVDVINWLTSLLYKHRLTPVYAVVLFYETTSLMRPHSRHPFWEGRLIIERQQCQKNWWLNILYINNIFNIPTTVR